MTPRIPPLLRPLSTRGARLRAQPVPGRGRIALVTGASSGIGAAVAELLAERGARLQLVGRDGTRLTAIAERTAGRAIIADLGRRSAGDGGIDAVLAAVRADPPDLVVHAAGIGAAGPVEDLAAADVDELLDVNLRAPIQLTRALLPGLRERCGHVVFVASIAALGVAGEAVYSATKAGLRGFADALRIEAPQIGVTTVLPGVVDTPFFARRGVPYERSRPRPIPAAAVAGALLRGVERGSAEVVVPRWLVLGARVHGAAPGLFARASRAVAAPGR